MPDTARPRSGAFGTIEAIARTVPRVITVRHVRSRGHEDDAYVDLHVEVESELSTSQGQAVATP